MTASQFGIVGGAAVPHAPQLLSVPKSEDAEQVARVRAAMGRIGEGLRALKPDLVLLISNEHGDQFILDAVPAFMVHCGARAMGHDGHKGWWSVDGSSGYDLVRALQDENFDPAFTLDAELGTSFTIPWAFMGWEQNFPVLPLFVNAYVPPQPSPERCFAFGKALDRAVTRMGRRAVLIASGGLSHYPGTARYANPGPDLAFDRQAYKAIEAGNFRMLLGSDAEALDRTGNVEARAWLMLAGALGERRPDHAIYEENWHHTYAVFGWTKEQAATENRPWYDATPVERVELSRALHTLRTDAEACRQFIKDAAAFSRDFELNDNERRALVALDQDVLRDTLKVHPLLVAGAARRIGIVRNQQQSA
ncbi:MAG: hypothetical protein KIT85_09975 [Pseudolabrys sp.]|nr:hypothetical protein [Pseudolabrys sp.]